MSVYTDNRHEATITKLERNAMKGRLLLTTVKDHRTGREMQVEDYFVFQARLIRKFGLAPGVYGRQLVFWDGKGMDPEGWIYKSEDEMEAETGLGRHAQRKARAALEKHGVLETDRRGLPCRLWYRVNLEKLAELLEDPYSTWNQWKRGTKKDPETGKFYRPEDATLNHDSRQVPIGTEQERSAWGPDKEGPYTDLTSEDPIGTEQVGSLYQPDKLGPYTDPTITESTYIDNVTDNAESSSESSSESSVFQTAAGAKNRAAPHQQNNKNFSQDEEQEQDENHPNPTTSFDEQRDVESKDISEVRRVLEHGRHAPVALKHYRAGNISAEEVAEHVSWEVSGTLEAMPVLVRAVRHVLDEVAGESRAS